MSNEIESQGVNSNSIIGLSKVVVEYMENNTDIIVTPDTPLPVTGTFITNPETPLDVNITNTESIPVYNANSQGIFGDSIVANLSQEVALKFHYGIDDIDEVNVLELNSATVSESNSKLVLSTGTTLNSLACVTTHDYLRYRSGLGALARFTFGVTTGLSGTEQTAGIGDEEDGLFFSYRYYDESGIPDMCIVKRSFGKREIRTLIITTGSNSANGVTITLNGTAFVVSVSNNSGNANQTATNIVANFSSNDWQAFAQGNIVTFISVRAEGKSGLFSFSAGSTGTIATINQEVAGATPNEDIIPRTNWSYDKADGSGQLPLINWANGNVFQIKYQWLGFGMLSFYIENPNSGLFVKVHSIEYANSQTIPSLGNPTLPVYFCADNHDTTNNVTMFSSSAACFIEGTSDNAVGEITKSLTITGNCTTSETLLFSIFNPLFHKNKNSRIQIAIQNISVSAADGVTFRFYKDASLTGTANWIPRATNSTIYYDTSSTNFSGGYLEYGARVEQQSNNTLTTSDISRGLITLHPNEILSVQATSDVGNVKVGISINWIEFV